MEEQTNQLTNGVKKDFKNIWAIILAVVITSFITGGSVYVWQNQQAKKLQDQISTLQSQMEKSREQSQQQITNVEKEKLELEEKYCKGVWNMCNFIMRRFRCQ